MTNLVTRPTHPSQPAPLAQGASEESLATTIFAHAEHDKAWGGTKSYSERRANAIDLAFRLLAIGMLSIFVYRVIQAELRQPSVVLTLLVISETLMLGLVIFAKRTTTRLLSIPALVSTAGATFYFLFISLDGGDRLVPAWLSESLMVVGMGVQITSKIYLGRNFGLLPAMRGIVTRGPYRLVRHPIYFGYLIGHIGFLLNVYAPTNVIIFILLYVFQFGRILNEEKVLVQSPEYKAYMSRVTKRLIPYVL